MVSHPVAAKDEEGDSEEEKLGIHSCDNPGQEFRGFRLGDVRDCQGEDEQCHGDGEYPVTQGFYPGLGEPFPVLVIIPGHG